MEPTLGWTVLSRDALRRAEAQLHAETEGVRDEIGFLNLHQAYANRFFPGTTVLQTRLRYVLFIPWMYNTVTATKSTPSAWRAIQEEEKRLIRRLKHLGVDQGIIGGRNESRLNTQPAAMVYWSALQAWNIIRRLPDGNAPSRYQVHQYIERMKELPSNRDDKDDDQNPLEEKLSLFVTLPKPPENWLKTNEGLDFKLTKEEAVWIRKQLMGVGRNGLPHEQPSVLALLADISMPLALINTPWSLEILEILNAEEREVMVRAGQVSALSAIGRAVYDALVELMCVEVDHRIGSAIHRDFLSELSCSPLADEALKANLDYIVLDAPHLMGHSILHVLRETQDWLRQGQEVRKLLELYRSIEVSRKGRKAQLANNLAGQQRRADWNPVENPQPAPLNYRWNNVKRLLEDLRASL